MGIKYNPASLLWDQHLRDLVGAPHCHFWDAMHCLFSSGGIVQYQLNGYVLELCKHNITCVELDMFAQQCKGVRLPTHFFSDRVVHQKDSHIKGFASEY